MVVCLFLVVGFFFPKISGFQLGLKQTSAKFVGTLVGLDSTGGHEAGIYALAVSDRLVASGSKVGWGGEGLG